MCLVPPKISHFDFAKDLNVGDRTSVQCVVVTGDLPLIFTWLKDNVPIKVNGIVSSNDEVINIVEPRYNNDNNNRFNSKDGSSSSIKTSNNDNNLITIRQNDDFTSALSIITITKQQAGQYSCRVQNDAATVQYSAQLKVNGIKHPALKAIIWKMTFSLPFFVAIYSINVLYFIFLYYVLCVCVVVEQNHQNLDLMALARDILHVTGF